MKSISISNLYFSYNKTVPVFENLNLKIEYPNNGGHIITVMGNSGVGKSTFFKLLLDVIKPSVGHIKFTQEKPVFSYVPQTPVLFEHLSVDKNASFLRFTKNNTRNFNSLLYKEVSDILGLNEILNVKRKITELSEGQKQRISLLRAMSIQPNILLLDEPLTGLDEVVKEKFLIKLLEISDKYNLLVFYITHHSDEAKLISNDILYLVNETNSKTIKTIHLSSIGDFIKKPPTVSAAKSFKDFDFNILQNDIRYYIKKDLYNKKAKFIGVYPSCLSFNSKNGIKFEVLKQTEFDITLKLGMINDYIRLRYNTYFDINPHNYKYLSVKKNYLLFSNNGLLID